jgi:hypothetical protein
MVGRGIYQALRLNPDCAGAAVYAAVLKDAYPHIVSELGGQIIMLEAREVDTPYLDRKINYLKIMALLDPDNLGLPLSQFGLEHWPRCLRLGLCSETVLGSHPPHRLVPAPGHRDCGDQCSWQLPVHSWHAPQYRTSKGAMCRSKSTSSAAQATVAPTQQASTASRDFPARNIHTPGVIRTSNDRP